MLKERFPTQGGHLRCYVDKTQDRMSVVEEVQYVFAERFLKDLKVGVKTCAQRYSTPTTTHEMCFGGAVDGSAAW